AVLLSLYHYKIERDAAYLDLLKSQDIILDQVADRSTVPMATFDLTAVGKILDSSLKDDPIGRIGFGIQDAVGNLQAGAPSKEFIQAMITGAESAKAWGKLRSYPEGRFTVI